MVCCIPSAVRVRFGWWVSLAFVTPVTSAMQHHCFYPLHSCPLGALSRSGKPWVEPCLSALRQLKAVKPLFIPPSTVPPWGEPRPPPRKMFCLCCTKNPHTPASCYVRFWCVLWHGSSCRHECFQIGQTLFYFGGACPLPPSPHVYQWSNLSLIPPPVPLGGRHPVQFLCILYGLRMALGGASTRIVWVVA